MIQLLLYSLLFAASIMAETCPGGRVRCPDFMTCCQLSSKLDFGCCPFPEAKCCSDHIHCCPHSMDCDIAHQSCSRNGSSVQLHWQVPINAEMVEPVTEKLEPEDEGRNKVRPQTDKRENANECPDNTVCHSTFTCCKMYSGSYGCCPFNNGTCCKDGFHCCPHGSKCSASGECESVEGRYVLNAYPMNDKKLKKIYKTTNDLDKPLRQEISDPGGICPDGHSCPEKFTCCKINGKRYGCCPYTDAMCCDDGIHCCPHGTTCNTTLGTCDIQRTFQFSFPTQPLEALQWKDSAEMNEDQVNVGDIVCPDEHYHCPSHTTCCQLESGAYGCCPMERATCCEDKAHCCPYGFECTVGGCVKGSVNLPPFLQVQPREKITFSQLDDETSLKTERNVSSVICPDGYPCPSGNTCCELETGDYGCCPMEKATCCADKIHCCPHGYRCVDDGCRKDTGPFQFPVTIKSTKLQRDHEVKVADLEHKHKEMPEDGLSEICPDKKSECPDGATCCEVADGSYGCCAYEDATCCGDQVHCCPHGYWCTEEGCDRLPGGAEHYAPFLLKLFTSKESREV